MEAALNKRAHAVAAQLFGAEAHAELRAIAVARGYDSWSKVPIGVAREIVRDLQNSVSSGVAMANAATPGLCTRRQRNKISAIRHAMRWKWAYLRKLVAEYGVSDWTQLTSEQADHLIQRLEKIAANMKRRSSGVD